MLAFAAAKGWVRREAHAVGGAGGCKADTLTRAAALLRASVESQKRAGVTDSLAGGEAGGGDSDGMQRSFQVAAPEIQKFVQHRVAWGDIEVLPDEGLQQAGVVRQMIQDLRGGQAIVGWMPDEPHVSVPLIDRLGFPVRPGVKDSAGLYDDVSGARWNARENTYISTD